MDRDGRGPRRSGLPHRLEESTPAALDRIRESMTVQPTARDKGLRLTVEVVAYDNGMIQVDGVPINAARPKTMARDGSALQRSPSPPSVRSGVRPARRRRNAAEQGREAVPRHGDRRRDNGSPPGTALLSPPVDDASAFRVHVITFG